MTLFSDLDIAATQMINNLSGQNQAFDTLMIWISAGGIPLLVLAVAGQWWVTDRQRTRHVLVSAGLSFGLGLAINQVILLFVDRLRPYAADVTTLLTTPSADPSFPSDHSTAAFAIAVTFSINAMPRRALWFGVAALIVALSRIYIGTHYVSDISGGALTGAFAAVLVRAFYRKGTRLDNFITNIL